MNAPTITISPDVKKAILAAERTNDSLNFGPPGSMPLPLYKQTVKVLEQLGIKWDKKRKCHVSATPISAILDQALSDGKVVDKKKLEVKTNQFFPTTKEVADQMARAMFKAYGPVRNRQYLRILEPSAGDGDLVRAVYRAAAHDSIPAMGDVVAVEIDGHHENSLNDAVRPRFVIIADFLTVPDDQLGVFDLVIMNPPFSEGRDLKHIRKAVGLLKPGGVCVALSASGSWTRGIKAWQKLVLEIEEMCDVVILKDNVVAGTETKATSTMRLLRRK